MKKIVIDCAGENDDIAEALREIANRIEIGDTNGVIGRYCVIWYVEEK